MCDCDGGCQYRVYEQWGWYVVYFNWRSVSRTEKLAKFKYESEAREYIRVKHINAAGRNVIATVRSSEGKDES